MKIGIDISQIVHEGTGVSNYVRRLVETLIKEYPDHEYILFGASLRKRKAFDTFFTKFSDVKRVRLVSVPIPPIVLDALWNILHIVPVEWFIGYVDVFWSSDWTQPPLSKAKGVTTIHDLSFVKYPSEAAPVIVKTHKRRLKRASCVCDVFFCDSLATKNDARSLLNIPSKKLIVVYPGL